MTQMLKQFIKKCIRKFGSIANKSLLQELGQMQERQRQEYQVQTEALRQEYQAQMTALRQEHQAQTEALRQEHQAQANSLIYKIDLLEKKQLIYETQNHYRHVRQNILERMSQGKKLRFASYVVYDSVFGAKGIVDLMLKEPEKYDIKFVVCPDVYRDMDGLKQYHKTKDFLTEQYGKDNVLDGYDENRKEFVDWSDSFDVVYMANPYDVLVNRVHGIRYMSTRNVLPFFICYGYIVSKWFMKEFVSSTECSLLYKYFVETKHTELECSEYQIAEGRNIILSGYPKMDALAGLPEVKNSRKKILIAPHHTVKGMGDADYLQLSNFMDYSDFILELPDLYPQADFVFRPHPLLFKNLLMKNFWTQEQVDSYIEKIQSKKNVVYSTESEYLHLFRECDALIHDCGSYMVEWLYTGKPCCYVVETEEHTRNQLSRLCNEALGLHTEIADSREKISDFISRVLNDEFQVHIDESVKSRIMVNYPNSSQFIFENLLK
ncbi:MAG: hypothetical protein K6G00_06350 [Treponema sp.]|nr:hypothetical protein [Treponema sp.]